MAEADRQAGWRSRVKIVTDNWRRKVEFATPGAEKSIMGTVQKMRSLMDAPMIVDGEVQTDDMGDPIPRRRFWQMENPEAALALITPQNIMELESLEQLADVIYIARFDPATLQQVLSNRDFLARIARIRDADGNNLMHWIASAALPQKTLFTLSGEMRKLAAEMEDQDETLVGQIAETLRAENHDAVKLHEIAFAMKDQHLASELMRARFSVREKNRRGSDFVTDALRSGGGEAYIEKLKEIVQSSDEKIPEETKDELEVTEEDRERASRFDFSDEIIDNLRNGDQQRFKSRLQDAIDGESTTRDMFFQSTPQDCAKNRGLFHFGQLDREGNDWMFSVIQHGDLAMVEQAMSLIERHTKAIADVFMKARPGLDMEEVAMQLVRMYLKTANARGMSLLQHAVSSKKVVVVQRLLQAGLYKSFQINSARDLPRKREMLSKNMALLVGRGMKENLFLHAATMVAPRDGVDDAQQGAVVLRMLEALFETMSPPQAHALFQMTYRVGRPPKPLPFLEVVEGSDLVMDAVKEAFRGYAERFSQAA